MDNVVVEGVKVRKTVVRLARQWSLRGRGKRRCSMTTGRYNVAIVVSALTGLALGAHAPVPLISAVTVLASHDRSRVLNVSTPMATRRMARALTALPLAFEANRGQADARVRFLVHGPGYTLFLTTTGATFMVPTTRSGKHTTSVVRLHLAKGVADASLQGENLLPGTVSYYHSPTSSSWHTNIPTYEGVVYPTAAHGVSLRYDGSGGQLEYTLTVAPGVNPVHAMLTVEGGGALHLDGQGRARINLSGTRSLVQSAPRVYQTVHGLRRNVKARYVLRGPHTLGLALGVYDAARPLVVDPVIALDKATSVHGGVTFGQPVVRYATTLGGQETDFGSNLAVDKEGHAYITGDVTSSDFPLKNATQPYAGGSQYGDAFITKLNATGTAVLFSTFFGGSDDEFGNGVAVDKNGSIYVCGGTDSNDFPVKSAAQPTAGGDGDAYAAKFDAAGHLVYSTYVGGSNDDDGYSIAVGASGQASMVGWTTSSDFPTLHAAQGKAGGGEYDAFAVLLDRTGGLLSATYLGGSSDDEAHAVAMATTGAVYIAGYSTSKDYPVLHALQARYHSRNDVADHEGDATITIFSPRGRLVYSTYLGGTKTDNATGIAVDAAGAMYVAGTTTSTDFPGVNGVQRQYHGGLQDAFAAKIAPGGQRLDYATYLGGSKSDEILGIAVDRTGSAVVAGTTSSLDFPLHGSLEAPRRGTNAFVARLDPLGKSLLYSTILGPGDADNVALGEGGDAYVVGNSTGTGFLGPKEIHHVGADDARGVFVVKLGLGR